MLPATTRAAGGSETPGPPSAPSHGAALPACRPLPPPGARGIPAGRPPRPLPRKFPAPRCSPPPTSLAALTSSRGGRWVLQPPTAMAAGGSGRGQQAERSGAGGGSQQPPLLERSGERPPPPPSSSHRPELRPESPPLPPSAARGAPSLISANCLRRLCPALPAPLPPPSPRPRRARRCCAPATKWRTAAAASPPPPCRPPPRRGEGVEPAALIGAAAAPAPLRPRTAPLGSAPRGSARRAQARGNGATCWLRRATAACARAPRGPPPPPGLGPLPRGRPAPLPSRPAPQAGAAPHGGAGLSAALLALPLRGRPSQRETGDVPAAERGACGGRPEVSGKALAGLRVVPRGPLEVWG